METVVLQGEDLADVLHAFEVYNSIEAWCWELLDRILFYRDWRADERELLAMLQRRSSSPIERPELRHAH